MGRKAMDRKVMDRMAMDRKAMERRAMDRKAMEREAMEFTEQGAMEVKMVTMVNHGRIAFAAVRLALAERNSMDLWFFIYVFFGNKNIKHLRVDMVQACGSPPKLYPSPHPSNQLPP